MSTPFDWARFAPESIALFSDIHAEFAPFALPEGFDADLIILAGDIHVKARAAEWAKSLGRPCVIVLGNHDHYGHRLGAASARCKTDALGSHIAVLDDDALQLANLRILGSTLWTDYRIHGEAAAAMRLAEANLRDPYSRGMSDHRKIHNARFSKARAADFALLHAKSIRFIERELAAPIHTPTLIATHHAPHPGSLFDPANPDPFDPCYASDLRRLMDGSIIQAWVHGHVHRHVDLVENGTRILANPRGYPSEDTGFDIGLRLSVARLAAQFSAPRPAADPRP